MGTKVYLEAITNSLNPTAFYWYSACNGVNPWYHSVEWVVPKIFDCRPTPGNRTYRVWIRPELSAEKVVKFREPDMAKTTISNIHNTQGAPQPGSNARFWQFQQTRLTWNGQPLGPCAEVCYKES